MAPAIPALGRQGQEDEEFQLHSETLSQKNKTNSFKWKNSRNDFLTFTSYAVVSSIVLFLCLAQEASHPLYVIHPAHTACPLLLKETP